MAAQAGLHDLINNSYAVQFRDPLFRLTVEAHRAFFLTPGNYMVVSVDDHLAYKYRYDLQGYLTSKNISNNLHYAIMRLNNMTSPTEFSYDRFKNLFIPNDPCHV